MKGERQEGTPKIGRRTGAGRSKRREKAVSAAFSAAGMLAVVVLAGIFILLLVTAIPAFKEISPKDFLLAKNWDPTSPEKAEYGILGMVAGTLIVTAGAMLIAVPVGIGTAAFLSEASGRRAREILKPVIEVLAGIPSVVIGFLGLVLFGPAIARTFHLSNGLNALNGSLLLAIMALPTIISISEDALNSVPHSYTEASLALGGTRWQTLVRVRIPAAASGIIAACMLGMGRAIGETMTVLMATGNARAFPHGLLDSVRTMTAGVAIELGEVPYYTTHYYALFAIGLALFLITFLVNMAADAFMERGREKGR